jgi:hypothetical protein
MRFRSHFFYGAVVLGFICVSCCGRLTGQQAESIAAQSPAPLLPEAPQPQVSVLPLDAQAPAQPQNPPSPGSQPAQTPDSQRSSSSQPAVTEEERKKQHEKAEEQLKQQESQRVMGIMAAFNTTRNPDAVPLSSAQKFKLYFRSVSDPWPFALTSVVAGIGQAENSNPTWGQGLKGYGKRFGAGYGDYAIGNLFGNAILTSLLHEDPRYFQKGTGSPLNRFLWAAASTVWCKRDKGTWGPNYANVGGNMIGAAIGRFYYPASGRTVGDTITDGFTVSAEGIVGAEVIEFWPDMVRRHRRKQAEKLARIQVQQTNKDTKQPSDAPKQ